MAPFLLLQFLEYHIWPTSGASLIFHDISFQVSVLWMFPRQGVTRSVNTRNLFVVFVINYSAIFSSLGGCGWRHLVGTKRPRALAKTLNWFTRLLATSRKKTQAFLRVLLNTGTVSIIIKVIRIYCRKHLKVDFPQTFQLHSVWGPNGYKQHARGRHHTRGSDFTRVSPGSWDPYLRYVPGSKILPEG